MARVESVLRETWREVTPKVKGVKMGSVVDHFLCDTFFFPTKLFGWIVVYHQILQAYDAIRPFHFEWRPPPPPGPPENHKAALVYKLNIDSLTKLYLPSQARSNAVFYPAILVVQGVRIPKSTMIGG